MIIRDATAEDWPEIFPIFSAIVCAGTTYAYPEDLSSSEAQRLWMAQPPGKTVVAARDGTILGSATMGPNRPGRGAHVATAGFMVDPTRHGQGTGRQLGEYVVQWAQASGYRAIQFNAVVETNHAAVHLWKELGFTIIGTVPKAFAHRDHGYVGLHVMFHSITDD